MPDGAFRVELEALINRCCRENASNTPDFLLAEYVLACLHAFERGVRNRDAWYGISPRPGGGR